MVSVSAARITRIISHASLGSLLVFVATGAPRAEDGVQFNTDVLDLTDRNNIDLTRFSRKGFILPGTYTLKLSVNGVTLPEREIRFMAPADDPDGSVACLTPELVSLLGLTDEARDRLRWTQQQCLDPASLPGLELTPDLASSTLLVNVPHAWLEYSSPDWDPPERWEEGIPGLLLDYSLYGQTRQEPGNGTAQSLSGNGVAGMNLAGWRLRADWQGRHDSPGGGGQGAGPAFDFVRYYAYRALPKIASRLVLGEDYLNADLFDSFRYAGVALMSDSNMRPPGLQGYAPEVTGIARTNARVVVSQQGRVIREVSVAAGPFRIQDLNSAVTGALDVRVEEADGSVQTFVVDTASVPYLTRPGQVNYKVAVGRPSEVDHRADGPLFAMGEFSWGVSNGWSLLGGVMSSEDYHAVNTGVGRDLLALGAVSFDLTQSFARVPDEGELSGKSYRVNYSKSFESLNNDIQLGAYRFSDGSYLSMAEFMDASQGVNRSGRSKETYTFISRQRFTDLGFSVALNYSRHNYWDRASESRLSLSMGRTFDIGPLNNVYVSLYGQRSTSATGRDDSLNLTLSLPLGTGGNVSYNGNYVGRQASNGVSYYDRRDNGDSYRVGVRTADSATSFDGSYSHESSFAQFSGAASYQSDRYSTASLSMEGGATLTPQGGALHRTGLMGGTRMLVDTGGVAGVPVSGYGSPVYSNTFGKAVVGDVNSYYRNTVRIDVDNLADDAEVAQTVAQGTLTEGAIGFRRFEVVKGQKIMAEVRTLSGDHPPFGATVINGRDQETGIITDAGALYLTGVNPGETMRVRWGDNQQCRITLPAGLPAGLGTIVSLTCVPETPAPAGA